MPKDIATETVDSPTDSKALSAEIDAGVEAVVKEVDGQRAADDGADKNKDKADPEKDGADKDNDDDAGGEAEVAAKDGVVDDEGEVDDGADGDEADAITDARLEKAVQVGLTMAEARQFKSGKLLDSMIARLETKQADDAAAGDKGGEDGKDKDGEGDDPLSKIPDLDPNEYDEKIVEAFAAVKEIARAQAQEIKALRGNQSNNTDWIKAQVAGMGAAVSEAVQTDPTKLEAVREKYAVLEAGYKAAGKDVAREAILQEAVSVALGDVVSKAKADQIAKDLKDRSRTHVRRAAGHRGTTPHGDPAKEIADEIDQKYFKKTA
jgi:hypothetical protein